MATSLLGAVTIVKTPVFAQDTTTNLDNTILFPERFSLVDFFQVLAQASGSRVIAPGNDTDDLTQKLNAEFGGRRLAIRGILEKYFAVSGLAGYSQDSLVVMEAPFLGGSSDATKTDKAIQEQIVRSTPALELIASLNEAQIKQMYQDSYVGADWLTPEQKPLYVEFIRQNHFLNRLKDKPDDVLSAEDIFKAPYRFFFSLTASFSVEEPGKNSTMWIGLYDYGRGLIWNPLVPSLENPSAVKRTTFNSSSDRVFFIADETPPPAPELKFDQTRILSVREALNLIEKASGKKIIADKRLTEEKLQQAQVIISQGRYTTEELRQSVPAVIGAELRSVGDSLYLGEGDSLGLQWRQSRIVPQVQKARQVLQRLPDPSSAVPFFPYLFDQRRIVDFSKLEDYQKTYIRARLKNDNTRGYDEIDLDKSRIHFANTMWFSGAYGTPPDSVMTMTAQIW